MNHRVSMPKRMPRMPCLDEGVGEELPDLAVDDGERLEEEMGDGGSFQAAGRAIAGG